MLLVRGEILRAHLELPGAVPGDVEGGAPADQDVAHQSQSTTDELRFGFARRGLQLLEDGGILLAETRVDIALHAEECSTLLNICATRGARDPTPRIGSIVSRRDWAGRQCAQRHISHEQPANEMFSCGADYS